MKRYLPIIAATLIIIAVQISCTYWYANRPSHVIDRLERLRLDTASKLIYANLGVQGSGESVVIAMTPHAVIQIQFELTRFIEETKNAARMQN